MKHRDYATAILKGMRTKELRNIERMRGDIKDKRYSAPFEGFTWDEVTQTHCEPLEMQMGHLHE